MWEADEDFEFRFEISEMRDVEGKASGTGHRASGDANAEGTPPGRAVPPEPVAPEAEAREGRRSALCREMMVVAARRISVSLVEV